MINIKRSVKTILCCLTVAITVWLFAAMPANAAYRLSAPKLSSAVSTAQGVKVSWGKVKSAPRYRVYLKNGNTWKKLADTTANDYQHKTAVSGVKYTYAVCCISADGSRVLSAKSAAESIVYVQAPQIKSIINTAKGANISWGAVKGAAKYRVFVRNGTSWKRLADTASCSYTHNLAVGGKTYSYTVRCLSADGKTFTGVPAAVKSNTYVNVPSITGFEDTLSGTKIKWTVCKGASLYRVYVKNGASWRIVTDTAATSCCHFLANGVSCTYTVRCLNAAGKQISAYNTAGWTHRYQIPQTDLETPVINGFESTENGLVIRWNPVEGAVQYLVMVNNNGVWEPLGKTADPEYCCTDAVSDVSRTYTVCCISADGKAYASSYNQRGKTYTFVQTPVIHTVVNTAVGPMICWNKCSGAARYLILTRDESGEWTPLTETAEIGYIKTDAAEDELCTFTVCCLNSAGNPVSAYSEEGCTIRYNADAANHVISAGKFAENVGAILGKELPVPTEANAPLNRRNAAGIIISALGYQSMPNITLSDSDDKALHTAVYYGYFIPDSSDRIFPDALITAEEYDGLITELNRYQALHGKKVLAFGDSIMFGSGNHISGSRYAGMVHMISEKYGMSYRSYAIRGATFGIRSDRDHIPAQVNEAYLSGFKPDIILLNGGTNDMNMVYRGVSQDHFDPDHPEDSTFAFGFEYTVKQIRHYWGDVPIIYIRAHNMDVCPDDLERQLGDYGIALAQSLGVHTVDVYNSTDLNTENADQSARYTKYVADKKSYDSVHPNALAYATFYLPLIGDEMASILMP